MADAAGKLWGRRARVTIAKPSGSFSDTDPTANALVVDGGDGDPPGLRIVFRVTKTNAKAPNTSEITIYNLAQETRAKLQQKGLRVLLEAGYVATGIARVFVGDVRTADPIGDGVNWKMVLKCGDGERSFRFARAAESFAGGTTVGDVVRYCAAQMGLALGNSTTQAAKLSTQLAHGWTSHGAASTELDRILRSVGYRYSIQDGEIQILAPGESLAQTVPLLSPETGLVGWPEMGSPDKKNKPATLKFKALLMPQARPGCRVQVRSERCPNGVYRALRVEHTGDTRGNDWYSSFESVLDPTVKAA